MMVYFNFKLKLFILPICFMLNTAYMHYCHANHYFKIPNTVKEPRLAHQLLTSIEIDTSFTKSTKAYNSLKNKVPLFDLHGTHQMQGITDGLCKDFTNDIDLLMIQLALLPGNTSFANLSVDGSYSLTELNFAATQNLINGFFLHARMPLKFFHIQDIVFEDLSPKDIYPTNEEPVWLSFKKNMANILAHYGMSTDAWKQHGIGDLLVTTGWTISYQDTVEIDFIDATLEAGLLLPTSKKADLANVFALPFGHEKHLGFPLRASLALGIYEWLTFGCSFDGLIFLDKKHDEFRMKISEKQSTIFLPTKGQATVNRGSLWEAQLFMKADHVVQGLSVTFGYTFMHQQRSFVTPFDNNLFSYTIVNNDNRFKAYTMHTIHLLLEYDFTEQNWSYGPRVAFGFHKSVSGKQVFDGYTINGIGGLEIAWDYL